MNLDHLEKLAAAAEGWDWQANGDAVIARRRAAGNVSWSNLVGRSLPNSENVFTMEAAHHIAAANPQAVLALIAVARAAQAYCDEPPFHPGDPDARFAELSSALAALGR